MPQGAEGRQAAQKAWKTIRRKAIKSLNSENVLVVTGDIKRGFAFYGPFVDEDDARTWARKQFNQASVMTQQEVDATYTLAKVYNPLKGEGRLAGASALPIEE